VHLQEVFPAEEGKGEIVPDPREDGGFIDENLAEKIIVPEDAGQCIYFVAAEPVVVKIPDCPEGLPGGKDKVGGHEKKQEIGKIQSQVTDTPNKNPVSQHITPAFPLPFIHIQNR